MMAAMVDALRLAIVAAVLVLLARVVPVAWRNRRVALTVWRRLRPHHVLGSLALLAAVLGTALTLLWLAPPTRHGAGSLIGLSGNAVFAPLEEAMLRGGGALPEPAPAARTPTETTHVRTEPVRPEPWLVLLTVAFLAGLLLLVPWLAYVEERTFREGLEHAGLGHQVWRALQFGLVHLVMLIPLAAALAIAVAGFAYGRAYRRAYRRAQTAPDPGGDEGLAGRTARLRSAGVLESTTWHAAFNSVVVLLVLLGFAAHWALGW